MSAPAAANEVCFKNDRRSKEEFMGLIMQNLGILAKPKFPFRI